MVPNHLVYVVPTVDIEETSPPAGRGVVSDMISMMERMSMVFQC